MDLTNWTAYRTTKIDKKEAEEFFKFLTEETERHIKKHYRWYWRKGYWPIKAVRRNKQEKNPKFIVNHHTGGNRTRPVMARFLQSKKASSNVIVERNGNIIELAGINDMSFHAILKEKLFIRSVKIRRLLNLEKYWINEYGCETIGNGSKWLFTPKQFKSLIVLQRNIVALKPTITRLRSHRYFNSILRANDPGMFYFLPLVEHAVFNDISLDDPKYWVDQYEKSPLYFAKHSEYQMMKYQVDDRDEWWEKRIKTKVTNKNLLDDVCL